MVRGADGASRSRASTKLYQVPGYGFPGLHAESFQTARMAEAFQQCGVDVTIVHPRSAGAISWGNACQTYGLLRAPARRLLPAVHTSSRGLRIVANLSLRFALARFALCAGDRSVVLGRHAGWDPLATLVSLKRSGALAASIFVELHEPRHFCRRNDPAVSGYVALSEPVKAFLLEAGVAESRILVAPNAVDLRLYADLQSIDKTVLRAECGLPWSRPLICYTGQLGPGRNVETLIASMKYLDPRAALVLVGGNRRDHLDRVECFVGAEGLSERVFILGQRPAFMTARLQCAADVLVIPYNSRLSTAGWCSPLKLGEYLASGNPIVAFPIPALRAALRPSDVVWAEQETAASLAEAIARAITRRPSSFAEVSERLGNWTWPHRAGLLAEFMGVLYSSN